MRQKLFCCSASVYSTSALIQLASKLVDFSSGNLVSSLKQAYLKFVCLVDGFGRDKDLREGSVCKFGLSLCCRAPFVFFLMLR